MKKFLEYVADDIVAKYADCLPQVVIVFPNKRASLFLNKYLLQRIGGPFWSPRYITISELFRQQSELCVCDDIKARCLLHRAYQGCTGSAESLDEFWAWGQIILSDFDDIDKNMASARQVYANVSDIHALDSADYLSAEQKETIGRFFTQFSTDPDSRLKQRFLKLWNRLYDIYCELNRLMRSENLAYEGALYREVAERADSLVWPQKHYLFVGFNMTQQCEQVLFKSMKLKGLAHFYWDFDRYYLDNDSQEAGAFIAQQLARFPNELDIKRAEIYDNLARLERATFLSSSTENIQARYVADWLEAGNRLADGERTAIVLADEKLLRSLIHYLPPELSGKANITIGYPLSQSPVAAKVAKFLRQQTRRKNPPSAPELLTNLQSLLSQEALNPELPLYPPTPQPPESIKPQNPKTPKPQNPQTPFPQQLREESLFRLHKIVARLSDLIASGTLNVTAHTLQSLLQQIIQTTTMPFHGEPAVGVQIMGVLETRNLDFDHVLLLSSNEGNLPKAGSDASLIPYSIRKAHHLTTIDRKVSIYAYYFYRLLQRCQDVTLAYNSATDDGHTGQMSRFMLQLMAEHPRLVLTHKSLTAQQAPKREERTEIPKTPDVMALLSSLHSLSPSAIASYLRCEKIFYFQKIARLPEPDSDDITDSRTFGNIFHRAVELLYQNISGQEQGAVLTRSAIEQVLSDSKHITIRRMIDQAFAEELFHGSRPDYDGLQLINAEVILRLILNLLEIDKEIAPLRILALEGKAYTDFLVHTDQGERNISVGGVIDRLDQVRTADGREIIRVVDYKTGGSTAGPFELNQIFDPENIDHHSNYYLQSMLYASIVRTAHNLPVVPALLFIRKRESASDPVLKFGKGKDALPIADIALLRDDFLQRLKLLVEQIFDPEKPFRPTPFVKRCENCAFAHLCRQ